MDTTITRFTCHELRIHLNVLRDYHEILCKTLDTQLWDTSSSILVAGPDIAVLGKLNPIFLNGSIGSACSSSSFLKLEMPSTFFV